jgi:hypothetical protein
VAAAFSGYTLSTMKALMKIVGVLLAVEPVTNRVGKFPDAK